METPTEFIEVDDVSLLSAEPVSLTGWEANAGSSIGTDIPESEEGAPQLHLLYNNGKTLIIPMDDDTTDGYQIEGYISAQDARLWYRDYLGYQEPEEEDEPATNGYIEAPSEPLTIEPTEAAPLPIGFETVDAEAIMNDTAAEPDIDDLDFDDSDDVSEDDETQK